MLPSALERLEEREEPLSLKNNTVKKKEKEYPYAELNSLFLGFETHKFREKASLEENTQTELVKSSLDEFVNGILQDSLNEISKEYLIQNGNLQDGVSAILGYYIRNFVLKKKDLEKCAAEIIEIFKNPVQVCLEKFSVKDECEKDLLRSCIVLIKEKFTEFLLEKEEDLLKEHLCRYLMIYFPNAGFEINRTFRYSCTGKAEAKLVATQDWNPGDQIRACTGVIAELTREDELAFKNRDFSVMYSTKKKCMCLFLGPARFVNHDCHANTKFININTNVVSFKVVKPIKIGEEITTFYSANYFGENNQECLCHTCEKFSRNGFQTSDSNEMEELEKISKLVGSTQKRSGAAARANNFNYYDIPNFLNVSKTKKKEEQEAAKLSRCMFCHTPHSEMGSSPGNDTPFDPCVRCLRHLLIFNLPFPQRKQNAKINTVDESCYEIYNSFQLFREQLSMYKLSRGKKQFDITRFIKPRVQYEDEFSSDGESEEENIDNSPIDPGPDYPDPVETAKKLVVFHVGDNGEFWPGISIPKTEFHDSIFKGLTENDEVIRYFEDGSFLKVQENDTVFREIKGDDPRFDEQQDPAMKLAKDFLLTGVCHKKIKWKAWREKEDARKSRIKELEREREFLRITKSIKKAKKKARKVDHDNDGSCPLEKSKKPKYQRKRRISTPASDFKISSSIPSTSSTRRFRPGNHSESRKFKKLQSVKTGRIDKWSKFGSMISKTWKNSSILSYYPLQTKTSEEENDAQIENTMPLVEHNVPSKSIEMEITSTQSSVHAEKESDSTPLSNKQRTPPENEQKDMNYELRTAGSIADQGRPKNFAKASKKRKTSSLVIEQRSLINEVVDCPMDVDPESLSPKSFLHRKSIEDNVVENSDDKMSLSASGHEEDKTVRLKPVSSTKSRNKSDRKSSITPRQVLIADGKAKKIPEKEKKAQRTTRKRSKSLQVVEDKTFSGSNEMNDGWGQRISERKKAPPERFGKFMNSIENNELFDAAIGSEDPKISPHENEHALGENEDDILKSRISDQEVSAPVDSMGERRKSDRRRSKPERLIYQMAETINFFEAPISTNTKRKLQRRHSADNRSRVKAVKSEDAVKLFASGEDQNNSGLKLKHECINGLEDENEKNEVTRDVIKTVNTSLKNVEKSSKLLFDNELEANGDDYIELKNAVLASEKMDYRKGARKSDSGKYSKKAFGDSVNDKRLQQKSIHSFFSAPVPEVGATSLGEIDNASGPEIASKEAPEATTEVSSVLKVDEKSLDSSFEASVNNSMDIAIKKFVEGEKDIDSGVTTVEQESEKNNNALKNQEKENTMESLTDAVIRRSPEKTPVLPTRKNPNRRVSVSDLMDQNTDNSEL